MGREPLHHGRRQVLREGGTHRLSLALLGHVLEVGEDGVDAEGGGRGEAHVHQDEVLGEEVPGGEGEARHQQGADAERRQRPEARHQEDDEQAGDHDGDHLRTLDDGRTAQVGVGEHGLEQMRMHLDARGRRREGCALDVEEAGGGGADQDDPPGECSGVEVAGKHVGRGHVGDLARHAVADPDAPLPVGRDRVATGDDRSDPVGPAADDEARLAGAQPERLDGQGGQDALADDQRQRHPAGDAVLVEGDGHRADATGGGLEDGQVAHQPGIALQERARVAAEFGHRAGPAVVQQAAGLGGVQGRLAEHDLMPADGLGEDIVVVGQFGQIRTLRR